MEPPKGESPLAFGKDTSFNREVRLGLVLYGGVSLAIYISGVVQEFFAAVRGRGVYGLLKALLGSDIVVDIVSGSSAGGINGVLLGYALANEVELGGVSELWREHGDFARLMRPVTEENPPSLLKGKEYFQPHLRAALERMLDKKCPTEHSASKIPALDLFVTATDFHGQLSYVLDDLGSVVPMKNHRRVFKLKHRPNRSKSDLCSTMVRADEHEAWLDALATVCRSTATFPGAFEPVEVPAARAGQQRPLEWQEMLHAWSRSKSTQPFVLLDGGILDNKPFTHTLQAIYSRTAANEIDRKLFYVEPDPEKFEKRDDAAASKVPDFLQVVTGALSDLPAYESLADDFASLATHNTRVKQYQDLLSTVRDAAAKGAEAPPSEPELAFRATLYREARLRSFLREFVACVRDARDLNTQTRSDDATAGRTLEPLLTGLGASILEASTVDEKTKFLELYDLNLSRRRLYHVTYRLYDALYPAKGKAPKSPDTRKLLQALNRHLAIYGLLDRRFDELRERFASLPGVSEALAEPDSKKRVAALREELLVALRAGFQVPQALERWVATYQRPRPEGDWSAYLTDADIDALFAGPNAAGSAPLLEVLRQAEQKTIDAFAGCLSGEAEQARLDYERFEAIDRLSYPFEALAHLEQKDAIETVRISPADAKVGLCNRKAYEKTTGESLGHFGAFLKRSWRSNDALWGRLDTVTLMLEELLRPEAVERLRQNGTRLAEFLPGPSDEAVKRLFPASPHEHARLAEWLAGAAANSDDALKKLLPGGGMLELLIECAQREIVPVEVPHVVKDALDQGREWGTIPAAAGTVPEGSLDATVSSLVGSSVEHALANVAAPPMPAAMQLVTGFEKNYRVGDESVGTDIPPLTLLRLGGQAGLLLTRILKGSLDRRMPSFVNGALSPLYALLRFLTSFLYVFALTGRTRPVRNALRVTSFVLVAVGALFPKTWVTLEAGKLPEVSAVWAGVFLGVPLLFLLVDAIVAFGAKVRRFGYLFALVAAACVVWGLRSGKYAWLDATWQAAAAKAKEGELWPVLVPLGLFAAAMALAFVGRSPSKEAERG